MNKRYYRSDRHLDKWNSWCFKLFFISQYNGNSLTEIKTGPEEIDGFPNNVLYR